MAVLRRLMCLADVGQVGFGACSVGWIAPRSHQMGEGNRKTRPRRSDI